MPDWNAARYLRFAGERTRPCLDLVARMGAEPRTIIDLGCGPCNSTSILAARRDHRPRHVGRHAGVGLPRLSRHRVAAQRYRGLGGRRRPAFDLIFSNDALQSMPDHASVFPRLLARACVLAVHMPAACDSPAQRLIRELVASTAWRSRFTALVVDWYRGTDSARYGTASPNTTATRPSPNVCF
jgi:trans-aconitate 2-methyltransferase